MSFQWMLGELWWRQRSDWLGRKPSVVHYLGDDHLIIHSDLLGVAAGPLALCHGAVTEFTTLNIVRASLNWWQNRFCCMDPKCYGGLLHKKERGKPEYTGPLKMLS